MISSTVDFPLRRQETVPWWYLLGSLDWQSKFTKDQINHNPSPLKVNTSQKFCFNTEFTWIYTDWDTFGWCIILGGLDYPPLMPRSKACSFNSLFNVHFSYLFPLIYGTLWLLIQKLLYQSSMIYTVTILDFTRVVAIFWASPVNPLTNFTSRAPLRWTNSWRVALPSGSPLPGARCFIGTMEDMFILLRIYGYILDYWRCITPRYRCHIMYIYIYYMDIIYIYAYIYIVHHGLGIAISWWFFTVVSLLKLYEPVLVEITHGNGIQSSWCFSSRQWLYHGHEWS